MLMKESTEKSTHHPTEILLAVYPKVDKGGKRFLEPRTRFLNMKDLLFDIHCDH